MTCAPAPMANSCSVDDGDRLMIACGAVAASQVSAAAVVSSCRAPCRWTDVVSSPQAAEVSRSAVSAANELNRFMDQSSVSPEEIVLRFRRTRWIPTGFDRREPPLPRGCGLRTRSQATGLVVCRFRRSEHEPPLRDSAGFSPASLNTMHLTAGAMGRRNHSAAIAYARPLSSRPSMRRTQRLDRSPRRRPDDPMASDAPNRWCWSTPATVRARARRRSA